jgi:hypothetical protein
VDAEQYSSGEGTHFLTGTDAVMDSFYTYCYKSGPKQCAFFSSSPSLIATRLSAFLETIRISPVIVPSSSSNSKPELITYSKVRKLISSALYRPLVVFPSLAEALSALEASDGKPFIQLSPAQQYELPLCDSSTGQPADPSPEIPEMESSADASLAILGSDQAPFLGGVSAFSKYLEECESASKSAGATMASMRLGCVDWGIRAKWRYAGPFKTNISIPILFVGNTADNVTPLRNAHKSAEGFPGSVVLAQNSYGHTSLSMPSRCTAKTIRAYFQDFRMPEKGTVCEGDLVPFQPWNSSAWADMGSEDAELDEALKGLAKFPLFGSVYGCLTGIRNSRYAMIPEY